MKEEQKQEPDNILRVVNIRDYFAAIAMQSLLRIDFDSSDIEFKDCGESYPQMVAEDAYIVADAMIEQRTK